MESVLKARDDSKVSTAAAKSPKQIGVLLLARAQQLSVGGNDVRADKVVARQTAAAHQPSKSATERESGNAGARDRTAGRRQTVSSRRAAELGPRRAAAGARGAVGRVDDDTRHLRQFDDE